MKKKLLILPLIIICLITGMLIGSCGKITTNVNANQDNWKRLETIGDNNFYIWTDKSTGKEYIIFHNDFYNQFSICPRQ